MSLLVPESIDDDSKDDILSPSFNQNATDTFQNGSEESDHNKTLGILMLAIFAIAINMVLFLPPFLVRRRRLRAQRRRRMYLQAAGAAENAIDGESKDVRYYKIESWVVSKEICAHDEICDKVCRLHSSGIEPPIRKQTLSTIDSADTDLEDEEMAVSTRSPSLSDDSLEGANSRDCPICFDAFQAGEIASWSADPVCKHVFHHRCIKEWLVNHKGCPFCRETFLPIDRFESSTSFCNLSELILAQEQRSKHCYYCVDHGIVSTPKDLAEHLDEKDWTEISQRAQVVPDRSVLYCMRGPVEFLDYDIDANKKKEVCTMEVEQEVFSNADAPAGAEETRADIRRDDDPSP